MVARWLPESINPERLHRGIHRPGRCIKLIFKSHKPCKSIQIKVIEHKWFWPGGTMHKALKTRVTALEHPSGNPGLLIVAMTP